jgi:hypothetical protein
MITKGALGEEDFIGLNVCNKNTVHEMVSMSEKMEPSSPECGVRKMWKRGAMQIMGL